MHHPDQESKVKQVPEKECGRIRKEGERQKNQGFKRRVYIRQGIVVSLRTGSELALHGELGVRIVQLVSLSLPQHSAGGVVNGEIGISVSHHMAQIPKEERVGCHHRHQEKAAHRFIRSSRYGMHPRSLREERRDCIVTPSLVAMSAMAR